ncbi:hypothetical protein [Robertkochia flava]|uniref:hypothetical protein n=1 Tax=Robertkochia flava TaxID=3447986 RepID=UPI001CCC5322|nr:hypothetical protein [Robertkochia marina]
MKRKLLFLGISIAILICLSSLYMFFGNLESNKKSVFIFYSVNEENPKNYWAKFRYLFPEDFNPYIAVSESNRSEILKLNQKQRELYDSIQKSIYPFKAIFKTDSVIKYSIQVSPKSEIYFEALSQKEIPYSKAIEMEGVSIDSVLSLIPDVYITLPLDNNRKKREDINYNLVLLDSTTESAWLLKVNPNYIVYE